MDEYEDFSYDEIERDHDETYYPDGYDEGYEVTGCEADADALASAGWGTDEDYGSYDESY